ncbi:MAG: DUF2802 domain-containing protein [Pseudomonadota bacterium]
MSLIEVTYPQILACVFATLFVMTFLTLIGVRRQLHEHDGLLKRLSELVRSDLDVSESSGGEFNARFADELTALRESVNQLRKSDRDVSRVPDSPAIAEAVALVRQGVDAEVITDRFDMSRGEAELMIKLHRKEGVGGIA